ncbi:phosphopantetheine-binding protein [Streptococcus phocae subsp. salmonis]|uniref:phosphopantetheine-binding protein n=1 Tax=Streptococcus phocae TaxID=119224 RepID=UPI000531B557|nr:phosphopantetheine-binding protein [Streptococcus phocae]KGR72624.1 acyl carrier protein [Streptococcus phocae subsp. salmonis]
MTKEAILEKLILLMRQQKSNLDSQITEKTHLRDDLGVDSIELVEFVINVEDEFGIAIPDEDIDTMTSIGELVDYLVVRLY